jgi:hypothetical protein
MIESLLQVKDICPFMQGCRYCDKDCEYTGMFFDVKGKIHKRFACRRHTKRAMGDVFIGNTQFVIDCGTIITNEPNLFGKRYSRLNNIVHKI